MAFRVTVYARARAARFSFGPVWPKKGAPKKRPYLAGGNAKSGPAQVIRWRENATFFLQKVPVFALFACNFPHLGFHFGAPKAALYKGISEIKLSSL